MGAEFVHGRLPATLELCKRYELPLVEQVGPAVGIAHGIAQPGRDEGLGEVLEAMTQAPHDQSVDDFCLRNADSFSETALTSTRNFIASYAAADTSIASAKAQGLEFQGGEDFQYRIKGGYEKLIQKITEEIQAKGVSIHTNSPVKNITWNQESKAHKIHISTIHGEFFEADKCLITIPISQYPTIEFQPALPEKLTAASQIGFGSAVKAVLRFSHRFWLEPMHGVPSQSTLFFLNNHAFPVFWTAEPSTEAVLTAWLGGPSALAHQNRSEAAMTDLVLASLGGAFRRSMGELRRLCLHSTVVQWADMPYIQGAYSYRLAGQLDASERLATPIGDQLYFAGEGTHFGSEIGTVEAAFASASRPVEEMTT